MADTTLQIIEQPTTPETPPEETVDDTSEPSEPIKADQINGVMVLSLLDKIIGAVDQIQLTQTQLEERQQEMENVVGSIQGELAKLSKSHATTSNTASKMLEKVRKVSVNVKTVRHNLEKQAAQIKKLESNESELLRRRNFKVMIYQGCQPYRRSEYNPSFAVGSVPPVNKVSGQIRGKSCEMHIPIKKEARYLFALVFLFGKVGEYTFAQ
uniref:Caveolae associated protein 1 n=1 Tax=Xenopus tropicalis TaxID=8364 RepID=A0A1B8Y5Q8_XENTR